MKRSFIISAENCCLFIINAIPWRASWSGETCGVRVLCGDAPCDGDVQTRGASHGVHDDGRVRVRIPRSC